MPSPPWALHTCSSAAAQSLCLFKAPATTEIYTLSLHDALAMVTRELRSLAPDVVGLQEASIARGRGHVAARLASALGLHWAHASATRRISGLPWIDGLLVWAMNFEEGPAVLSRFPIAETS